MNLRLAAAGVLVRVMHDGQSLTAALEQALQAVPDAQDKAFVQALCYGVCRYFHRLDFVLSQLLDRPLKDDRLRALILLGLYQLGFMRVKTHAAVSETVHAAGKKPWAKGLVNAVLRRYLREQAQLEAQADAHPSASFSHPDWLVEKIRHDWPEQAEWCLLENNLPPPLALRVNLLRTTMPDYLDLLAAHNSAATPVPFCASALLLDKPLPALALPGFAEGLVSVQDVAAQLAAGLLDVQPGQRVLDMCAAPGGKTAHLLEIQPQLGELVAVEIDAVRLLRVKDNLQRLGLQAHTVLGDAARPEGWWDGRPFERILVDAPCSALGVIRRHPDIKLLRRDADIAPLKALQKSILHAAWRLLASGGVLLYATCSVLKEENEQQVLDFLAAHSDAAELPINADWGFACRCGRQILTGESAMDGFYYARIAKI